MFSRLSNGDEIVFLPNILKDGTFGDFITRRFLYFFNKSNKIFYEKEYYPELRLMDDCQVGTRYFSYVLLNGEYKIIQIGESLYKVIKKESSINSNSCMKYSLNIIISKNHQFPNYENSYFGTRHNQNITEDFLNSKSIYLEDFLNSKSLIKNINVLKNDYPEIKNFINGIRKKKINRILDEY